MVSSSGCGARISTLSFLVKLTQPFSASAAAGKHETKNMQKIIIEIILRIIFY